jgi:hypothetical protein
MNDDPIIHVEIQARTLEDLRAFADEVHPDLGCRPIARRTANSFVMDAYLPESQLEVARVGRAAGRVSIRVIENATEVGRERQKEVGQGNRFAARGTVPRGLGRKE